MVERLLREKISLQGICHAMGVSIRWLVDFMVACFEAVSDHLHLQPVASPRDVILGCLGVEADELWSFVQAKTNKHWVWIAMDKQTRQISAFHVGDRSHDGAKQLWANIRGRIAPRGAARAQVPRSAARRVPVSGCAARSRPPLAAASTESEGPF